MSMMISADLSCSHENASGYYRVTVFFLAQVLSDLIPKRIIPVCFYAVIVYFMIGEIRGNN